MCACMYVCERECVTRCYVCACLCVQMQKNAVLCMHACVRACACACGACVRQNAFIVTWLTETNRQTLTECDKTNRANSKQQKHRRMLVSENQTINYNNNESNCLERERETASRRECMCECMCMCVYVCMYVLYRWYQWCGQHLIWASVWCPTKHRPNLLCVVEGKFISKSCYLKIYVKVI